MDKHTQDAVAKWKNHRYKPNHVPFAEAVNSLLTESPLITLSRSVIRSNEWTVCHVNTSTPAVMTFAGVFAEAEPYDTGNLVIGQNEAPPGLNEVRITRFAGFKAAYSYAIETYHDKDIWDLQQILDELAKETPGFNTAGQPRLEWQNGETQGWRFYMRVPMFLPYQARGEKPKAPPQLHSWVKQAHERTRSYRANPNRPQVRAIEDGEVRDIAQCTPPRLEYGDVVGLVFTVVYTETPANWSPVYMLTNIIRVMHANRNAYPLAAEEDLGDAPLDDGELSVTNVAPPAPAPALVAHGVFASAEEVPVAPTAPTAPVPSVPPADSTARCAPAPTAVPSDSPGAAIPQSPQLSISDHVQAASADTTVTGRDVATDSPPPAYVSAVQSTEPVRDPEADEDDATSSTTEATRGSRDTTPAARGIRTSGGTVGFVRTVRPRLDDGALDGASGTHILPTPNPVRARRGVPSKSRGSK